MNSVPLSRPDMRVLLVLKLRILLYFSFLYELFIAVCYSYSCYSFILKVSIFFIIYITIYILDIYKDYKESVHLYY